jgi:hypothetical protein
MLSPRVSGGRHLVVLAFASVLLISAGCSSGDDSAAGTTTTTTTTIPSTCDAMEGLSTALTSVVSEDTLAGGKSAVQSAVDDVQTAFDQVEASASDDFGADVDALSQAIDDLSAAVSDLGSSDGVAATVLAIGAAANEAIAAYDTLAGDVDSQSSGCDLTVPTTIAG